MGMDVYGTNPKSENGRYFRNNVWWWHPLWTYCCEVSKDARSVKNGHSNDGDGLTAAAARRLAVSLKAEIASGRTSAYSIQNEQKRRNLPRHRCQHCNGTGIRSDAIGVKSGWPEIVCPQTYENAFGETLPHPRAGQKGSCNACAGLGTVEDFGVHYPFSVDNVEEFILFLEDCGGFEIC